MKPLFGIACILLCYCSNAQDVIVKTDKSEIKSKVLEITESAVRYKKWENQEGPVYNINKTAVFLIIYANGQREVVTPATSPAASTPATETPGKSSILSSLSPTVSPAIDTSVDYKNAKVKYKPGRAVFWFQTGVTTLGLQQEMRLLKNVLNLGFSTDFTSVTGGSSSTLTSTYASPYLAINRLTHNYENQDKGLFVNAKLGYSVASTTFDGKTYYSGAMMVGFGADYYFTRKFGVNLGAIKIGAAPMVLQGGISFSLLR